MSKSYHLLIVDDEESMNELLSSYLRKEGYQVSIAQDGLEAIEILKRKPMDLVVLDVMMPLMDGLEACRMIRKSSYIPIIMLTAKGEEADRVVGLNIGADDYMVKPFSLKELIARIEALLRRSNRMAVPQSLCHVGHMMIDTDARTVKVGDEFLLLTRKEYELLLLLATNKEKVFSREQLHEHVWGMHDTLGTLRTVDTHIKTLRLKLGTASRYIATVWGVGYKLEVQENED